MAAVMRQFAEAATSWVGPHLRVDESLIIALLAVSAVAAIAALLTYACSCTHQFKDALFFLSSFRFLSTDEWNYRWLDMD